VDSLRGSWLSALASATRGVEAARREKAMGASEAELRRRRLDRDRDWAITFDWTQIIA
jgi:hypothetical protein